MGQQYTPSLIDILQKTLLKLESAEGLDHSDAAYHEMTRHIARIIAELELMKSERAAAA